MKLVLLGTGRMGREVEAIALERGHTIAARLSGRDNPGGSGLVPEAIGDARMAIDFSVGAAVPANVRRAAALGMSVVVGTTGWEEHRAEVERAVREAGTGLLHAPNFSLGMLLFMRVVEEAARLANRLPEFDLHLAEAHHRHKVDHPGGTARRIAELLVDRLDRKEGWSTELPPGAAHPPERLQVAVTRAGEIPGIHTVGIDGPDDRIELRHEARSRRGLASGAVRAAEWLEGRPGVHTLDDLLDTLLD